MAQIDFDMNKLITHAADQLTERTGKVFLDCRDLMQILGIGRDNVRALMNRTDFPCIRIGNRKIVSVLNFVIWQLQNDNLTSGQYRANM